MSYGRIDLVHRLAVPGHGTERGENTVPTGTNRDLERLRNTSPGDTAMTDQAATLRDALGMTVLIGLLTAATVWGGVLG